MREFPHVISVGEVLWDVFCLSNGGLKRRIGGAPANFAYHVAQQGMSACAVSALGQDAAGDELAAALAQAGAPCVLQRVPYATGEVEIVLAEGGIPHYNILPNAAWDYLAATPELLDMARHARAICFGTLAQRSEPSRTALAEMLEVVPADCLRIVDVNLRCGFYTPTLIQQSLQLANVLKLNNEEMEILGRMEGFCGLPQLEQACLLAERYGLHLLILTCGALGSYVLGQGGQVLSWRETPAVRVGDTVGAGDSFTAAFISGVLHGLSVAAAHAAAVQLAAFVCSQQGAMPPIPEMLKLQNISGLL